MTKNTDANIPCENCTRTGFPILFTRYGIAYSATSQGREALKKLTPKAPMQSVPGMSTVSSNVRMLRAGYLYLYLESDVGNEWKGYALHQHGYVSEFAIESPVNVKGQKACQRSSHAANASLVWIEDAKRIKTVWYLFNPDPLDPQHLRSVVAPNRKQYMQQFSPQKWLGGDHTQAHSTTVSMLELNIFEYAALSDEKLQRCSEALMYGLMGSNAQERGWGDYEEAVEYDKPSVNPNAALMGVTEPDTMTVTRRQPGYAEVHGQRLRQIKDFLSQYKGAVLACDDAFGIAQELGHMQGEGELIYTHWQLSQAEGYAKGVSNEWVFQSAVNGINMRELVKQGAVKTVQSRKQMREVRKIPEFDAPFERKLQQEAIKLRQQGYSEADVLRELNTQRAQKKMQKENEKRAKLDSLENAEILEAQKAGDQEFSDLFDQAGAENIIKEQGQVRKNTEKELAALGLDQSSWIKNDCFTKAMQRYSDKDAVINKPGGGAALSLNLAQSMAGSENNASGKKMLMEMSPFGDNALSKLLSFNNEKIKKALQGIDEKAASQPLPKPEESDQWYDKLSALLKPMAGHMALGDKALSFIAEAPAKSSSAMLRSMAWPAHVASLMSVKMVQGLGGLPATQFEAKILRSFALLGLSTLGSTAAVHAQELVQADRDRLRNAEKKLATVARRNSAENATHGASQSRVAILSGVFDLCNAAANIGKLNVKRDARSATETLGSLLQSIGSILDYKAKAYEETIFKGVKGAELFNAKAMQESMDKLNYLQIKRMRLSAFKFLLPAAMISVLFDLSDAWSSVKRRQVGLAMAQVVSGLGTVFSIVGVSMTVFGWGTAFLAASLGLIGAAFAGVAIVAIIILSKPDWINWLADNPLNIKRKGESPNHKNLQDTLQKFANAQAAI